MSDTQLPVLEHTIQQTNIWLKKLVEEHHLRLRDRLTPEQAVHFAAQLPILVRGIYYEGWHLLRNQAPGGTWTNS